MKICAAVIGNSSSGIIEAPAFGVPTVNIGSRQDGRLRADSIIDVATNRDQIKTAIETALSSTWQERCAKQRMRYRADNTAQRIADTLKTAETNQQKTFFDIS
jgi:UDP-N-acetylglucosamine 2-epimerase